MHKQKAVQLGLLTDFQMDTYDFTYIIGMEVEEFLDMKDELAYLTIPAATYAVFTTPLVEPADFSSSIQATWKAIFEEWFSDSDYEHAETAEFELYDERSQQEQNKKIQMEIWIPVRARTYP